MQKELKILLIASGLSLFAGGLFAPLYAVFVEGIGGDLSTAGIAYSIFAITGGVLIFVFSRYEDRIKDQGKLIAAGYGLASLGYLGYFFVSEIWHLYLIQVVFGIGQAVGVPAYDSFYAKNVNRKRSDSEWGNWESMARVVVGVSALIGGFLAKAYGFKILFAIMFFVSLLGVFASLRLIRKS